MELKVEIDLARDSRGVFAGTFGEPAQGVKGLPLSSVTVEASAVRFVVKGGPEPATFDGALSADGTSIAGTVTQNGFTIPMNLSRTGDARIARVPKSAPIAKELEGTWNGTLDVNGVPMRLVVKMANQPDGTASGTVISQDGSGVEIAIGIVQQASNVTIDVPSVGASYVGSPQRGRDGAGRHLDPGPSGISTDAQGRQVGEVHVLESNGHRSPDARRNRGGLDRVGAPPPGR